MSVSQNFPYPSKRDVVLTVLAFASILSAVLIALIGIGIEHPGKNIQATVDTNLYQAFLAVCNIVFSFCKCHTSLLSYPLTSTAGHVAFFSFMAELKDPKDYPKSLCLLQGIDLTLYIVSAVVIYCYAGQDVTSPALGSASPVVRKVAYGIALPTVRSNHLIPAKQYLLTNADCYRRCRQRPRCLQIRLRPFLSWH